MYLTSFVDDRYQSLKTSNSVGQPTHDPLSYVVVTPQHRVARP